MTDDQIARELITAAKSLVPRAREARLPPEIARLESKFEKAISQIRSGIDDYGDVMRILSRHDNPEVARIGKRGVNTARERDDSWGGIQDDFLVLKNELEDWDEY